MDSLTSMKQKLAPLGLYNLDNQSEVLRELKAYAEGLDILSETLDELERECRIATAESYGLSRRESLLGREHPEQAAAQRRKTLNYFEKTVKTTLNDDDFADFLENIGVTDYTIEVRLKQAEFNITFAENLTDGQKALVEKRIRAEIPAHMTYRFHYPE